MESSSDDIPNSVVHQLVEEEFLRRSGSGKKKKWVTDEKGNRCINGLKGIFVASSHNLLIQ